jgi:hypothetical protein
MTDVAQLREFADANQNTVLANSHGTATVSEKHFTPTRPAPSMRLSSGARPISPKYWSVAWRAVPRIVVVNDDHAADAQARVEVRELVVS